MTRATRQHFASAREVEEHARCRYCPASIVWVTAESGRRVALDYDSREPVLGGGFMLEPHRASCQGTPEARRRKAHRDDDR